MLDSFLQTGISGDAIPATTNSIPQAGAQGEAPNPPKPFYDFDVVMTCGGCSSAIERVLKKNILERESHSASVAPLLPVLMYFNVGLTANKYDVSLERQNVKVWGPSLPSFETVREKIGKTGKTASSKSRSISFAANR